MLDKDSSKKNLWSKKFHFSIQSIQLIQFKWVWKIISNYIHQYKNIKVPINKFVCHAS